MDTTGDVFDHIDSMNKLVKYETAIHVCPGYF